MKFVDKTKNQIPIQADFEKADSFMNAVEIERKRRKREDRHLLIVKWIGGISAFVCVNGLFVIFLNQTGIIGLFIDKWKLGYTLCSLILMAFYFGLAFLLAYTFFWLSDRTGLHYLIEDWIVSWDTWDTQKSDNIRRYRSFPRRKRRALIRDLKKELNVITDQLYRFELEAEETEDEKLSESVESLNQVIGTFVTEVDISSRSLIHQPEHASWKGFVLALEETSNNLELELKDMAKYHSKIQPLVKHAADITSMAFY